jgi:hypothetical protein
MEYIKNTRIQLLVVAMLMAACTTPTMQLSPSAPVLLVEPTAVSTQVLPAPAETEAAAMVQVTKTAFVII